MTRTFAFLIVTTFKNRLVSMARRVRQPRYAIGLILGLVYVGFFIWGQVVGAREMRAGLLQNDIARVVAPAVLALVLLTTWFGGATLTALAFTKAEVSLLFPAPVSRRALVLYKLATAQLPIIINALILAFVFGRGPAAIPRWLAPISLWVTFSTLHLHRLGAALAYASAAEHGRSGFKRNWFSHLIGLLIFSGMMAIFVAVPIGSAAEHGGGGDGSPLAFLNQAVAPLSTPLAQAVLYPFSIIVAPAFARTVSEWVSAMGPALFLLALHAWWVLRSQGAFEEAAIEASDRRHQIMQSWRHRGTTSSPRKVREGAFTLPLGATGSPAVAILWKNTLCFLRTFRPLPLIAMMGAPIAVAAWFGMKRGEGAVALAGVSAMFALVLLLAGGSTVRNDLRADMLNLSQLKALPLRGRDIVLAEVASSTIPLALMQLALLYIALVSMQVSTHPLPAAVATSLTMSLPFGIVGLTGLISTIRNGATVFFPSWTKLGVEGTGGPGGFEVIGQAMLSMLAMFITLLVLLVIPALVTLFIIMYVQPSAAIAIVFSVIVGAFAVVGESWLLIAWIGRAFERTEPSSSITAS